MLTTPAPPASAPTHPAPSRRWDEASPGGKAPSWQSKGPGQAPAKKRPSLWTALMLIAVGLAGIDGHLGLEGLGGDDTRRGVVADAVATVGRGAVAPVSAPVVAVRAMPTGKGMWIYEYDRTEGGNVEAIVARARETGITHLYPRLGSHWDGYYGGPFLDQLLPVAHAAGLTVFGWDFPRLGDSLASDIDRARAMITHTTPAGHRLDGFSADIETINEGSHVSPDIALVYGRALRDIAGPEFTLIATVPRPSPRNRPTYPYAEIVESFDAIAPMIYWLNRQPDTDVIGAMDELAKFGKPIFPVGQAYDGAPEGGRAGVPPPEELHSFMKHSLDKGAQGVSFWSWQAADDPAWAAIRDAAEFRAADQPPL